MTEVWSITAIRRRRPLQRGQAGTPNPKVRRINSARCRPCARRCSASGVFVSISPLPRWPVVSPARVCPRPRQSWPLRREGPGRDAARRRRRGPNDELIRHQTTRTWLARVTATDWSEWAAAPGDGPSGHLSQPVRQECSLAHLDVLQEALWARFA